MTLRTLFHLCTAIAVTLHLPAMAQQEPEFVIPPDLGFLRVVNATGHPGRLWATVNGVKLAASSGYEDGAATGAMGIQEKALRLEFRHDSLGEVKRAVTLKAGVITTVIAVAQKKKEDAPQGGKEGEKGPELGLHLLEMPVSSADQPSSLTVVQFTPAAQLSVEVAPSTLSLKAAEPQSLVITPAMGSFVDVKLQGKIVAQLNFMDPAGQGVVLYTNAEGVVKSTQFRNDVQ